MGEPLGASQSLCSFLHAHLHRANSEEAAAGQSEILRPHDQSMGWLLEDGEEFPSYGKGEEGRKQAPFWPGGSLGTTIAGRDQQSAPLTALGQAVSTADSSGRDRSAPRTAPCRGD